MANFQIVIVLPTDAQIRRIFDRLEDKIDLDRKSLKEIKTRSGD